MSVEVSLAARNPAALNHTLKALYTKHSGAYRHWLAKGKFDARFAPTAATRAAVGRYLASQGLKVQRSSSPFLVRASGSSQRVSAAFHTTLSNYRNTRGVRYFSNSSAVRLPASLAGRVLGVIGLSSTVREHSMVQRPKGTLPVGKSAKPASCEAPYPTAQQLFDAENGISGFPFGFGGSPGCNGLTPSQDNGIYDAPHVGPRGQGAGVNIAVFELSAYQASDVNAYTTQFYGPNYHAPLVNVNVDGGPLNPVCPAGDICPPNFNGFAGDVEVDADIETQLAIAPAVQHLIVYNAPNDFSGQTELDEYAAIASDDTADSISSSWAVCENDAGTAVVQSERSDGTTIVNVLDPPPQPWVTSVGGTSLETANPGTKKSPSYPSGVETVWNVDNLCNSSANEGGFTGFFWCAAAGSSARLPLPARRAARIPMSRPTRTSSRRMPSSAPPTRTRHSASADSVLARLRPAGSESAGRACPHRCGQQSSPTATASRASAAATSTHCCTCSHPNRDFHDITGSARPPTTTACSRLPPAMTSRPGSERRG